jgi:hypothetical protein
MVAQGALEATMASSPVRFSTCDRLGQPDTRSEPQIHPQPHLGDDDTQSQQRAHNPCHRGRDYREGRNLILEGPGPKAFGGAVHNSRYPWRF